MLLGTHGTSRTRAEAIVSSRTFVHTASDGHSGAGVYFWAYETALGLAAHLARLWWATYFRQQKYATDADPSCAILDVGIECPSGDAYLDATTVEFRETLTQMASSFEDCDGFELDTATAYVVDQIESRTNRPVLVMKALLKSPSRSGLPSFVARDFPMSAAYVVRQHGNHLIRNIKLIDEV